MIFVELIFSNVLKTAAAPETVASPETTAVAVEEKPTESQPPENTKVNNEVSPPLISKGSMFLYIH